MRSVTHGRNVSGFLSWIAPELELARFGQASSLSANCLSSSQVMQLWWTLFKGSDMRVNGVGGDRAEKALRGNRTVVDNGVWETHQRCTWGGYALNWHIPSGCRGEHTHLWRASPSWYLPPQQGPAGILYTHDCAMDSLDEHWITIFLGLSKRILVIRSRPWIFASALVYPVAVCNISFLNLDCFSVLC